jgi:hypothetical protein
MSCRVQLAGLISLMVLGCATNQSFDTAETPQERAQREREQYLARENLGQIGETYSSPSAIAEKYRKRP